MGAPNMPSRTVEPRNKLLRPATWRRLITLRPDYLMACAIMKNEERWIAEWIAFHRVVGFDRFVLYDNGSDDRTLDIVRSLPQQDKIRIVHWPFRPGQLSAYQHAIENFSHSAEWIAFIDIDEFCVPVGAPDVRAVLKRYEKYGSLLLHWVMFGSAGRVDTAPDLCIEMFTQRAPLDFFANRHVKTIAQSRRLKQVGPDLHIFSVDGVMATEDYREYQTLSGGFLEAEPVANILRLHHYFVKSREHWREKVSRRRADNDQMRDIEEFDTYDRNDIVDLEAARFAPQVRKYLGMSERTP